MTSTPEVGSGVLGCPYGRTVEIHGSSPLTARGHSQLLADDLIPGSHLEVGDLVKRRMYPSGGLEGTLVTSHPETRKRRASVDHDTVGDLSLPGLMA